MKLILPLSIDFPLRTKKAKHVKYSLNHFLMDLSGKSFEKVRKPNHHYQKAAKDALQHEVASQLQSMDPLEGPWPKKVILTIYRGSNRHMDVIDNPSIITKFAMDIVKINHAPDDDFRYFSECTMRDGGLDKENPRAELEIVAI